MHLGKYELLEALGEGGMAEVWKARATGPAGFKRTLVLKRILPRFAEERHFIDMFLEEARLSAQLHHPNIVAVHDLGDTDGHYFIVMEYLRGRTLNQTMRALLASGPTKIGMAVFVVREMARALGYAHALVDDDGRALRIIHRDVSPTNVMLGMDGAVKLLDFGIAKALEGGGGEHTQTGTLKGKFGYMAPEQVLGEPVDHRIDVFATGVTLWECLTGKRLFRGKNDMETVEMVKRCRPPAPSTVNPLVPIGLDAITLKALARAPGDRYQTCDDLARDLDGVVHELRWGGEALADLMKELFPAGSMDSMAPERAAPPPPPRDLRRWLRAGVGVLALSVVGLGVLAWKKGLLHIPELPSLGSLVPEKKPPPPLAPTVKIALRSTPPGAAVYVDGDSEPMGTTPITLMLAKTSGAHSVRLTLAKYRAALREIVPDAPKTVDVTLDRASRGPLVKAPKVKAGKKAPSDDDESAGADEADTPAPPSGDDE